MMLPARVPAISKLMTNSLKNGVSKMKKILISVLVVCFVSVVICGCDKKTDKDGTKSTSSQTNSADAQLNMTEGVDEVTIEDNEENALEIDFETGSVISRPSNKNNSSSSDASKDTVGEQIPSATSSGASSTSTSSSSSSVGSSSSVVSSSSSGASGGASESDDNDEKQTMSGFSHWY